MDDSPSRSLRDFAILGTVVVAACVLIALLLPVRQWMESVVDRMESLGPAAPLIFLAIYIVLALLSIPSTPLNLASGILFGVLQGGLVALAGAWTAAVGQFLFARHVARDSFERRLESKPRVRAVIDAVDDDAFKVVLLTRLSPFLPASVKNFGFALTGCPLRTYALATALGQIPVVVAHVYLGWVGGRAVLHGGGSLEPVELALIGLGVLSSLALLVGITIHARRQLRGTVGVA